MAKRDELRITNPPKHLVKYVNKCAKRGKRTVPKQLELIIEEHMIQFSKRNPSILMEHEIIQG